ncbi:MAG: flagellin hook IN motif-containing protein [Myxococcota bacterium]
MISAATGTSLSQATMKIGGFARSSASAGASVPTPAREDASIVLRQTVRLRKALETLQIALKAGRSEPTAAVVGGGASTPGVGVSFTSRSASITSAEINPETTSFARGTHAFVGASTSAVTLSGTYTGGADDTLSFRALSAGTVGQDNIVMELRNQAGATLKFFTLRPSDGPDAAYEFDNGLIARFSAGSVVSRDTLAFDVSATTPGAVNPSRAFSGAGAMSPGFESGQSVTAGSFSVNGVSIAVGADDSINTVLARITASSAGVTARFDAQTERITLTRKQPSLEAITLGADSSGFLAATRLSEGTRSLYTTRTTAEIAQVGSSFGPKRPEFAGSSSAAPALGGTYTGARDETLTFTATRSGLVGGLVPLEFEVRDGAGALVDTVNFSLLAPPGTKKTLSNGLEFSLGSGFVASGDSFTVDVSATVGGAVNPAAAFNGGPDAGPRFDGGLAVTAGSFEVNGVQIAVAASDSIDSVLAKISGSAAGVSAAYDARTETIQLVAKGRGDQAISLGNDSSGFLAATRLSTSSQSLGAAVGPGDLDEKLGSLAAFSDLQSGTFQVGGRAISLNLGTDSMRHVIDRINAASAGVRASVDEAGKLQLESTVPGRAVTFDDAGTRFFETVGVTTRWDGAEASGGGRTVSSRKAVEALKEVMSSLNELYRGSAQPQNVQDNAPRALRDDLRRMVSRAVAGMSDQQTRKLGLRFDADLDARDALTMTSQAQSRLEGTLRNDPQTLLDFFKKSASGQSDGLLAAMLDRAKIGEKRLAELVGSKGQKLSLTG